MARSNLANQPLLIAFEPICSRQRAPLTRPFLHHPPRTLGPSNHNPANGKDEVNEEDDFVARSPALMAYETSSDEDADGNAVGLNARRSTPLCRSSSRKQKKLTVFLNTTNSSRMTTCVLVCGSINASKSGRQLNSQTRLYICVCILYICVCTCVYEFESNG